MKKILSIIVPTYNMEAFLASCLESVTGRNVVDRLDIIVVNDGSTDSSLETACRFRDAFPESVRVIDKPNGNYGSAINAALPIAEGKYVKILDADDRFFPDALEQFTGNLERLDSDIFVTHFCQVHPDGFSEVVKYNTLGKEPYIYGKVYDLDTVLSDGHIKFFLIHSLTYRTSLLKSNGYRQTEGISYSDIEWDLFPLFYAGSICFLDLKLYRYNLGRPGQTMDPKILEKSSRYLLKATSDVVRFFERYDKSGLSEAKLAFIKQFIAGRIRVLYKLFLLDMPADCFDGAVFSSVYDSYSEFCRKNSIRVRLFPESKVIRIDLAAWWGRYGRRLPSPVISFIKATDRAARFLYSRLLRR